MCKNSNRYPILYEGWGTLRDVAIAELIALVVEGAHLLDIGVVTHIHGLGVDGDLAGILLRVELAMSAGGDDAFGDGVTFLVVGDLAVIRDAILVGVGGAYLRFIGGVTLVARDVVILNNASHLGMIGLTVLAVLAERQNFGVALAGIMSRGIAESVLGHAFRGAEVVDDAFHVGARLLGVGVEELEVGELILVHGNWITGQALSIVTDILVVEDGERSCVAGQAGESDVTTNQFGIDGRFIA